MTQCRQTNQIVFIGVGALHLAIGLALFVGLPIQHVSSIASVTNLLGTYGTAFVMVAIGTLALCSTLAHSQLVGGGLLVSQQIVLIASAVAGVACAMDGHYADGTPADPWHIFFDQSVYLVMTIQHSTAILQTHAPEVWEWLWG